MQRALEAAGVPAEEIQAALDSTLDLNQMQFFKADV